MEQRQSLLKLFRFSYAEMAALKLITLAIMLPSCILSSIANACSHSPVKRKKFFSPSEPPRVAWSLLAVAWSPPGVAWSPPGVAW